MPRVGDLVVVREGRFDTNKSYKLYPRYTEPRRLIKLVGKYKIVGRVVKLTGSDKVKEYYINDLKVVCKRRPFITKEEAERIGIFI